MEKLWRGGKDNMVFMQVFGHYSEVVTSAVGVDAVGMDVGVFDPFVLRRRRPLLNKYVFFLVQIGRASCRERV